MRIAWTLAAAGLAACGALAAAGTASADGNAQATISQWENQGYQVNIDRVGSGPLSDCVVTSVRNPNTQTQLTRIHTGPPEGGPTGHGNSVLVPVVVNKTVQISLDCTGSH